jgi:Virulence factor BrkB
VGGLVFAIGWVVATALFAQYVANFANYSNTYGALGGVVVLMLWFYLTAVLLLLAAEATSVLVKLRAPDHIEARQREIKGAAPPGEQTPADSAGVEAPEPIVSRTRELVPIQPSRDREPVPTGLLAVLLVLAGVIAGALAGLLTRDGTERPA